MGSGDHARWRAHNTYWRWAVAIGDLGPKGASAQACPNHFGKAHLSARGGMSPDWDAIRRACERARKACPPVGRSGRYGSKLSESRRALCEAMAAALNADQPRLFVPKDVDGRDKPDHDGGGR